MVRAAGCQAGRRVVDGKAGEGTEQDWTELNKTGQFLAFCVCTLTLIFGTLRDSCGSFHLQSGIGAATICPGFFEE
jgi:hypothetical protein